MNNKELKDAIGYADLTKEQLLAKLEELGDKADNMPPTVVASIPGITKGQAYILSLFCSEKQQWELAATPEIIAEAKALRAKFEDKKERMRVAQFIVNASDAV